MGNYAQEAPLLAGAIARGERPVVPSLKRTRTALTGRLWIVLQALITVCIQSSFTDWNISIELLAFFESFKFISAWLTYFSILIMLVVSFPD